jgi:hypothetical protein
MKAFFTLLLATIFGTTAFAYDEGKLTVTFAAQNNVQVVIDGRTYQQQDNSIVINNIPAGQHSIRIYKARRGGRNNRNEVLYSANVYVKPSYHVDVMVNRFGKALVDEQSIHNRREDNDWYGNDHTGGYGNQGGYGNNNGYNQPVSESEFSQVVQRIKSQWFGSAKINTAKEELAGRYFTTLQVRQVLQLFASESDKMELAKLAYRTVVDNRNFYQLYDVFSFQSSKEELDRFVREFRY